MKPVRLKPVRLKPRSSTVSSETGEDSRSVRLKPSRAASVRSRKVRLNPVGSASGSVSATRAAEGILSIGTEETPVPTHTVPSSQAGVRGGAEAVSVTSTVMGSTSTEPMSHLPPGVGERDRPRWSAVVTQAGA